MCHMEIEPLPVNKAPAAKDFTSEMEGTLESVRKNLEKAKEQMKLNADKHRLAALDYTIAQQVWLATENLWLTHASCKLTERWLGPYTIIGLAGPNAIKLKLLRLLQIHPIVNISWIKPYLGSMEGQTPYRPRLVHVTEDRDTEWEVDHVTILFLGSALFLISSFCAMSPFPGSLSYAYHHYLLILGPLTFTICTL